MRGGERSSQASQRLVPSRLGAPLLPWVFLGRSHVCPSPGSEGVGGWACGHACGLAGPGPAPPLSREPLSRDLRVLSRGEWLGPWASHPDGDARSPGNGGRSCRRTWVPGRLWARGQGSVTGEPQSRRGRGRPSCLRCLCVQHWPCLCQECPVPPWGGVSGSRAGRGPLATTAPATLRAEPSLLWTPLPWESLETSGASARSLGWGPTRPLLGTLQTPAMRVCGRRAAPGLGLAAARGDPAEAGLGSETPAGPTSAGAAVPGGLFLRLRSRVRHEPSSPGPGPSCGHSLGLARWACQCPGCAVSSLRGAPCSGAVSVTCR